jgi:uncharacterized protein (DUF1778 family)
MTEAAKKQEEKKKRVNLNLGADTHRLFKMATAAQGTDMTHAILEFIEGYIRKHLSPSAQRAILRTRST